MFLSSYVCFVISFLLWFAYKVTDIFRKRQRLTEQYRRLPNKFFSRENYTRHAARIAFQVLNFLYSTHFLALPVRKHNRQPAKDKKTAEELACSPAV